MRFGEIKSDSGTYWIVIFNYCRKDPIKLALGLAIFKHKIFVIVIIVVLSAITLAFFAISVKDLHGSLKTVTFSDCACPLLVVIYMTRLIFIVLYVF